MAGCSSEPMEIPAEELYIREFIKKYGVPDADHSWSMARTVNSTINVSGLDQGTVEIYTASPDSDEAMLAATATVAGGQANVSMALPAGIDELHLRVRDRSGVIRRTSTHAVSSGVVNARVEAGVPSSATKPKAEAFEAEAYMMPTFTRDYYRRQLAGNKELTYPQAAEMFKTSGETYQPDPNNSHWVTNDIPMNRDLVGVPGLRKLTGLHYEMGDALSWRDVLSPVFSVYLDPETQQLEDGVFHEGRNNLAHYYHGGHGTHRLDPEVTFSVLDNGPVSMQCIWRGTAFEDYFGYFYYHEDDPIDAERLWAELPKFIFLTPDDITKTSTLTQRRTVDHTNTKFGNWTDLDGMATANSDWWIYPDHLAGGDTYDSQIRGRKYFLAYYGRNYDEAPTYDFPRGVRIGYFTLRPSANKIYLSDSRHHYSLIRSEYWGDGEQKEGPTVRPYAAKFRFKDRIYVGFGDESGDCDLNDIVFLTENVTPDIPDITPPGLTPDTAKPMRWTLACEDLGSTDDTDFNDIVIDIEHTAGSGTLSMRPRAAGGVLVSEIYFRERNNTEYTRVGEIHNLLSQRYSQQPTGSYPMLNTDRDYHQVDPRDTPNIHLIVPEDFDFADEKDGFLSRIKITTRGYDQSVSEAQVIHSSTQVEGIGSVPQMLLLDADWQWPTERVDIARAYPGFKDWVSNRARTSWTTSPISDLVTSHRVPCSHD